MTLRRTLEFGTFGLLALGVHVAAFVTLPEEGGAVASGAGGDALVSLQASSGAIEQMVADWERPPEVATELEAPTPPSPPMPSEAALDTPPDPLPDTPAPQAPPQMALMMPQMEAPHEAVALPSPPEPTPEPEVSAQAPEVSPPPVARPDPPAAPKRQAKPKVQRKVQKAERAQQASVATQGQRAAGSGGGAEAGDGGSAAAATQSRNKLQSLRASWGATIRARIERSKRYPSDAGRASGKVTVRLTVSRTGDLISATVLRSSGEPALDRAALEAVQRARRFAAAPTGLNEASYSFSLPMRFSR